MSMKDRPAYPSEYWDEKNGLEVCHYGMTLREYYAGLAMMGLVDRCFDNYKESEVASFAVKQADALIAELERTK